MEARLQYSIVYCCTEWLAREGDYLHYKTMCDAVREMLTPGRGQTLTPSHRLISLSARAGGDTCQFSEDQAGLNTLRDTAMILSVLLISVLHQTGLSQYDVVRLDPFRYVSPSLLLHTASAQDWDTISLHCPPNTKVRVEFCFLYF